MVSHLLFSLPRDGVAMKWSRRDFVKSSSLAAGVAVTGSTSVLRAEEKASSSAGEKLHAAVTGVNSRGNSHISGLQKDGGVVITHIVDVDENVGNKVCEKIAKWQSSKPEYVRDYRDLLSNDDVDVMTFATPNHWHSLQATESLLAGKQVYVEKPVSHNVWEGRQIVNAADKTGNLCQCGTQSRSSKSLQDAVAYVHEGNLGAIQYAIGTCYKARMPIGKTEEPLSVPSHIDYDLWCGPAAKVDLYRPKLHYDWHWDFNTGNGDMGNQGIHQMDIARWFLGESTVSPEVLSVGGRVGYDDAGDTPNTQTVIHKYEKPLIFETRGLPKSIKQRPKWSNGSDMDEYRGSRIGVMVQCENGYVVIPNYHTAMAYDNSGKQLEKWSQSGDSTARHFKNFLDAVRAGKKRDQLNGDIVEGHLSSALCHTGAVSHLMGAPASLVDIKAAVAAQGDLFNDSFDRLAAHCERNQVTIDNGAITLGATLSMDRDSEMFTGNGAAGANANHLRRREYREGFVVPEVTV